MRRARRRRWCIPTRERHAFTDITPQGPDGLFSAEQVDELVTLLSNVRARAVA